MTKFCRQHERASAAKCQACQLSLTKHGLLAVRSTKVSQEPILVIEALRQNFVSVLRTEQSTLHASMRCLRQGGILVPRQLWYLGYATGLG